MTVAMVTTVVRKPIKIGFGHLLKRWCSIKEIEVGLNAPKAKKKTVASLLKI